MRKQKWFRTLSLALAAGMLLTGCKSAAEPAQGGAETEAAEVSEDFNETGYPIVNEKINVSMMGSKAAIQGAWEGLVFFKDMEEKTNISFTFDTPASEVFEEKKNLALAGGKLPGRVFRSQSDYGPADQIWHGRRNFNPAG